MAVDGGNVVWRHFSFERIVDDDDDDDAIAFEFPPSRRSFCKDVELYCVDGPYVHIRCLLLLAGYYIRVISRSRHTLCPVFDTERNVLLATFL